MEMKAENARILVKTGRRFSGRLRRSECDDDDRFQSFLRTSTCLLRKFSEDDASTRGRGGVRGG